MVAPAVAAELSNGSGETCDGTGTYHFVNHQTRGSLPGTLTATFTNDGGDLMTVMVGASSVSRNNQHFDITTAGDAALVDASTTLPGRLVLSDFTCDDGGKKGKK